MPGRIFLVVAFVFSLAPASRSVLVVGWLLLLLRRPFRSQSGVKVLQNPEAKTKHNTQQKGKAKGQEEEMEKPQNRLQ